MMCFFHDIQPFHSWSMLRDFCKSMDNVGVPWSPAIICLCPAVNEKRRMSTHKSCHHVPVFVTSLNVKQPFIIRASTFTMVRHDVWLDGSIHHLLIASQSPIRVLSLSCSCQNTVVGPWFGSLNLARHEGK